MEAARRARATRTSRSRRSAARQPEDALSRCAAADSRGCLSDLVATAGDALRARRSRCCCPLSLVFGARRRRCAARPIAPGVLRPRRAAGAGLVVGNITAGGTGKTPLVIALVELLRARGFTPGHRQPRLRPRRSRRARAVHAGTRTRAASATSRCCSRGAPRLSGRASARDRVAAARALLAAPSRRRRDASATTACSTTRSARDVEIACSTTRGARQRLAAARRAAARAAAARLRRVDAVLYNAPRPSTPLRRRHGAAALARCRDARRLVARRAADRAAALRRACAAQRRARGRRHRPSAALLRACCARWARRRRACLCPTTTASRRGPWLAGADAIVMTEKDAVKCARAYRRDDASGSCALRLRSDAADSTRALLAC